MGVMEMTFPHQTLRQDSASRRLGHSSVLAVASARQAGSRTVAMLRRAKREPSTICDDLAQRIHYFSQQNSEKMAVCGAFSHSVTLQEYNETTVYQSDLANVKVASLNQGATGEQLNHAGHGALRKI
jgi:hypothetical protein